MQGQFLDGSLLGLIILELCFTDLRFIFTHSNRFSHKFSVKLHLLTHEKADPKFCKLCDQRFKREDCLIRHIRKWHKNSAAIDDEHHDDDDDDGIEASATHSPSNSSDGEEVGGIENSQNNNQQHQHQSNSSEKHKSSRDFEREYEFDVESRMISSNKLETAVSVFLCKLVDQETCQSIGWPQITCNQFLNSVIGLCGHSPIECSNESNELDSHELIRANLRLLFTEVEECSVQSWLEFKTVDETLLYLIGVLD